MKAVYEFFGGRKQFAGYLAYVTAIVLGIVLKAGFLEVMGAVLFALGLTQAFVAWEDRAGKPGGS